MLSILLALVMTLSIVPSAVSAAAEDVVAKEMNLAGGNRVGNLETNVSVSLLGNWPDGWEAVSVGLIPTSTALNFGAINSNVLILKHEEDIYYNATDCTVIVDMTSHYSDTLVEAGTYRIVIYASPGSYEEIFYSSSTIEVFDGEAPPFTAVTDITGVSAAATVGTPLSLTGTVAPSGATNYLKNYCRFS